MQGERGGSRFIKLSVLRVSLRLSIAYPVTSIRCPSRMLRSHLSGAFVRLPIMRMVLFGEFRLFFVCLGWRLATTNKLFTAGDITWCSSHPHPSNKTSFLSPTNGAIRGHLVIAETPSSLVHCKSFCRHQSRLQIFVIPKS